jgi:hypothetical protein
MTRTAAAAIAVCALWGVVAGPPGAAPAARAGIQVAGSIGEGLLLGGDDVRRTSVNFEVLPSYSFGIVSADLGFVFNLEDQVDLLLRPGARLDLWVLYGRLAVPLKVTSGFDWGLLLGVGVEFVNLSVLSFFFEIDASFYDRFDFHEAVPLEGRLGVEVGF